VTTVKIILAALACRFVSGGEGGDRAPGDPALKFPEFPLLSRYISEIRS
jgi:hypothetical protein